MSKPFVILLYGVGSNGQDMVPIGDYWKQQIADLEFAYPNAPFAVVNVHDAFQWFSLVGITPENRYERILNAREAFDRTIQDILDQHQLADQLEKVVFCGFSQGTIMALDAVVSGRWPVAGLIGMSGRLVSPISEKVNTETSILLMHGEADHAIPVTESINAYQMLNDAGFNVEISLFKNLGHQIISAELSTGTQFLTKYLK